MKTFNSEVLIEQLLEDTRELILEAHRLKEYDPAVLEKVPAPGKWSVAQVLEHLNIYARFYMKAIGEQLHQHRTKPEYLFKPGWLGNYFTKMMEPPKGNQQPKKMKAPANAIPQPNPSATEMLTEFLMQQHQLLNLLEISRHASLSGIRVPISISRFIRLKLGDSFRFYLAHEKRHFIQIRNVLNSDEITRMISEKQLS
jgi:hypothetical protein